MISDDSVQEITLQRGITGSEKDDIEGESERYGGASGPAFNECIQFVEQYIDKDEEAAPKQVNVPVYLTLLIKRLEDDPDDDQKVIMSGTMIQRCLFVDLAHVKDDEGEPVTSGFKVRVNEGPEAGDMISGRKKVQVGMHRDGKSTNYMARCMTSSFRLPMRRVSIFFRQPFNIAACETLLVMAGPTYCSRSGRSPNAGPRRALHSLCLCCGLQPAL